MTVVAAAYPLAHVGCGAVGGAETIAGAIESAVAAHGDRSILIAREGSTARGTLVPIPALYGPIDEAARHEASLLMRRAIEHVLAQFNVDLVHLHGFDFGEYVPASDVPTIVTLHLPVEWYPVTTLKAMADRVHYVCVSGSQRRSAASFGIAAALVENGVSLFSDEPVTKHHYVAALGRICPEKGFHEALDAAALANVELLLAGRTFPFREHERYFNEVILPRLDARRRFVGPVNRAEKIRLIGRARALLVPSRAPETSSLVAMEALALGTPVIAYPSGALSEIVEHGISGFIVRDVNEMAAAIRAAGVIDPDACRRAAAVRLLRLRCGREMVAVYYGFQTARRAAFYIGGFNPAFAACSRGSQLLREVLRAAIADGVEVFDFLSGREPYKYAWGARDVPYFARVLQPQDAPEQREDGDPGTQFWLELQFSLHCATQEMRRFAGLCLVVLAVSAPRAQEPPFPPPTTPPGTFQPLERYLDALRAQAGIPGMSAAVVDNGQIVWEAGFGFQDVTARIRATPDTPYLVGDLAETFAAVLLLQCVEQRRIHPDAPIALYNVQLPEPTATLRNLLSHSSAGNPGEAFQFSPERYAQLTLAMEWCAPQPYRKSVAHRLLDRLAMKDSVPGTDLTDPSVVPEGLFEQADLDRYRTVLARMAVGYKADSRNRFETTEVPRMAINAATGLVSTVRDLAQFDAALQSSILLTDETRAIAWTPVTGTTGTVFPTGLGWFVQSYRGEPVVWQFGYIPNAYSALMVTLPLRHITFILLANSDRLSGIPNLAAGDITRSIFAMVFLRRATCPSGLC